MVGDLLSQRIYVLNVKLKYSNVAELLHNALVAILAELLSRGTHVPNLQSKHCVV